MKNTQCRRLQYFLEINNSITPLESWTKLGIYRLSGRIYDLKRSPYNLNIKTENVKVYNHFGEPCHVAKYSLEKK